MAFCEHPLGTRFLVVKVNGNVVGNVACQGPLRLTGLFVHPGERARITLVASSPETGWQFAAYAWTPPATARPAPAEPRLPHNFTGPAAITGNGNVRWHLVASRSGDWPADQTVTITAPADTSNLELSVICAGLTGNRLQVSRISHGSPDGLLGSCDTYTPGQPVPGQATIDRQDGKPVTLTLRLQAPQANPAAYAKRTASWTVALYAEHK